MLKDGCGQARVAGPPSYFCLALNSQNLGCLAILPEIILMPPDDGGPFWSLGPPGAKRVEVVLKRSELRQVFGARVTDILSLSYGRKTLVQPA